MRQYGQLSDLATAWLLVPNYYVALLSLSDSQRVIYTSWRDIAQRRVLHAQPMPIQLNSFFNAAKTMSLFLYYVSGVVNGLNIFRFDFLILNIFGCFEHNQQ